MTAWLLVTYLTLNGFQYSPPFASEKACLQMQATVKKMLKGLDAASCVKVDVPKSRAASNEPAEPKEKKRYNFSGSPSPAPSPLRQP